MAGELFGLDLAQTMRLKQALELIEGQSGVTLNRMPRNFLPAEGYLVGILTDAVAATTGLTSKPKVGTANIYNFSSTGTVDIGVSETCYNFAPTIATTDRWTFFARMWNGRLAICFQGCSS